MPAEFLSDEQVSAYGRFTADPSPTEMERFFYLDDADRDLIARRRTDSHRLGFAVQLGTVRALGSTGPRAGWVRRPAGHGARSACSLGHGAD